MKEMTYTTTPNARPLIARLQPVTWLLLGLLLMFAGLAGLTMARQRERAAGQLGQPMSTLAVAMVDISQQQATRTPQPSRTPRPTNTARPTADKTATFFAQLGVRQTAAVKKSTVDARATQAIATFTPSPPTPTIHPAGYRAPWADKMVKQADGTWMAPKEVVDEATKHYGEYYEWLRSKDLRFMTKSDEEQYATYYSFLAGSVLSDVVSYQSASSEDFMLTNPKRYTARILRVRDFSRDGLSAICDIEIRNSNWKIVNISSGAFVSSYSLPDRIDSDILTYDPSDGRWKYSSSVNSVSVSKEITR
jgi:hypothetical protein